MKLKEIFCPFCGKRTKVDEDKDFCFCLECGSKIENIVKNSLDNKDTFELGQKKSDNNEYLDEKLKEVGFYMELSKEKKEYLQLNYEPTYYIKAQDILLELSEQFPNEYKIWWKLCKPLDFDYPSVSGDEEASFWTAMKKSKELLKGHYLELIKLDISNLLWLVLPMFSAFIGAYYAMSYTSIIYAEFYEYLKGQKELLG